MFQITLLIPYFGKFPPWAHLFFETLRRNPTIQFIFYTDYDTTGFEADNILFRKLSFTEYIKKANEIKGVHFQPANPYKLCDLRPLYPVTHYEDIKNADFYGWTDMDILFGDIRSFYTDEMLAKYDVLSTHKIRISGHFALFRNTRRNREMYKNIYDWQNQLAFPNFVGIDEHGITNAYTMTVFDKINEKYNIKINNFITRKLKQWKTRKLYMVEQYTTPFFSQPWLDGSSYSNQPDEWYYKDGEITNSRDGDRRFMYLHFMNFKNSQYRHDGSKAPWEGKEQICFAEVEDMEKGLKINNNGIFPIKAEE